MIRLVAGFVVPGAVARLVAAPPARRIIVT